MLITHIYSEFPDYQWVDAEGEGIACVDDVSRAVLVYLKHHELFNDEESLQKASLGLNFVMYMEEDGEFYNFIHQDYTINKTGRTSKKSFNWWAVRGLRALCYGYKVFKDQDEEYASRLKDHIVATFEPLNEILSSYGSYLKFSAVSLVFEPDTTDVKYFQGPPAWLVNNGGDATAEVVLALLDYYGMDPDPSVKDMIEKFSEGLVQYQRGDGQTFPFGAHLSWRNVWHAWGNSQTQALARAGRSFNRQDWIESAKREADNFYIYLLSQNYLNHIELRESCQYQIKIFPQISYGIRPMVSGLLELYKTTNDEKYAQSAGLAASWLRGNNPAGKAMYDPATGRCYDGIQSPDEINRNSGAESTIEALMTLLEISQNPLASSYYFNDLIMTQKDKGAYPVPEKRTIIYKDKHGNRIRVGWNEKSQRFYIMKGGV